MQKNSNYNIRPITSEDLEAIRVFTDKWIGDNYYSAYELKQVLELSKLGAVNTSFGAFLAGELVAVRLTLRPGAWEGKVRGTTPSKWRVPQESVAYFKSLFVSEDHQAHGLGKILSNRSIDEIKKLGGKAVLCHSWLESPNNSSWRYLSKIGFEEVARHEKYWHPIDYLCTRCAPERCICTAAEMIKYL